jgi:hypothetical protein
MGTHTVARWQLGMGRHAFACCTEIPASNITVQLICFATIKHNTVVFHRSSPFKIIVSIGA